MAFALYEYTPDELRQLGAYLLSPRHRIRVVCCQCGRPIYDLTRDTGFGFGWHAAAEVNARILHGGVIGEWW